MTLRHLADLARLTNFERFTWLKGCALRGDVLLVPDREQAGVLTRCYLTLFLVFVPALTVRYQPPAPAVRPSVLKQVYRGQMVRPKALDLLD